MSCRPPDADSLGVDDNQTAWELVVSGGIEEAIEGGFDLFDGGWPHSEADDACVSPCGIHSGVGEIFVERKDDGVALLGPLENGCVGGAS